MDEEGNETNSNDEDDTEDDHDTNIVSGPVASCDQLVGRRLIPDHVESRHCDGVCVWMAVERGREERGRIGFPRRTIEAVVVS